MVAGGAQRNTLLCAQYQHQIGHQVWLASGLETGSEGSLWEELAASPFEVVRIPSMVRELSPQQDLRALWQLVSSLRRHRPQVLHTHTSKAGLLGRLAGLICGVPVVVHTPHGHVFHSYFSKSKELLFKLLERICFGWCDAGVMLSSGCLRDHLAEKVGLPQNLYVIPSGVPLERFFQAPNRPEGAPVVGYVGRLADIKGPLDLVEAFALVKETRPQARLLMVGDGPQRAEVEQRISRLQLQDSVTITGWQEDTLPFLAQMRLLAVPSHNEGMGRVVVEAMAAGLPVVASRVGGLPDLITPGQNGWLARPKDPRDLCDHIARLLDDPSQAEAMGQRGRERAHDFSDQVMFERLEALYARLLSVKRNRVG